MISGFVLSLLTICLGGFLIYHDKDWEGFSMILATLVSLAGVFVYGRNAQNKELKASRDSFQQAAPPIQPTPDS